MANKKQRMKNRATALELVYKLPPKHKCPACGKFDHQGHYIGSIFTAAGFYICQQNIS